MRRMMWALALVLAACPAERPGGDGDSGTVLTETPGPFALTGNLVEIYGTTPPSGEIAIGLFDLATNPGLELDRSYRATTVAGLAANGGAAFALELPNNPEDVLHESVGDAPDLHVAWFVLAAWIDSDGDGDYDSGETPIGGSLDLIAHAHGQPGGTLGAAGIEEGWNVVEVLLDGDDGFGEITPIEHGVAAYDLDANLLAIRRSSLTGVIRPEFGITIRVDLYSIADEFSDSDPVEHTVASVEVTTTGTNIPFTIAGPLPTPPNDHFIRGGTGGFDEGVDVAIAMTVAYLDSNGDGTWDPDGGEVAFGTSIQAGEASRLVTFLRPQDFRALAWVGAGYPMGWSLVGAHDEEPVDWATGTAIDSRPEPAEETTE